jgi:hypothetical protein
VFEKIDSFLKLIIEDIKCLPVMLELSVYKDDDTNLNIRLNDYLEWYVLKTDINF